MSDSHPHTHARPAIDPHRGAAGGRDSLLCASVRERLLVSAGGLLLLWLAVWWAIR